jgi:hypothetical protein
MTTPVYLTSNWLDLEWSEWVSFDPSTGNLSLVPTDEGLYRIRHQSIDGLVYIGQTGRSLRGRLRALSGCYNENMPFTDPHVAAPCLWAIRQEHGPQFEMSWVAPEMATNRSPRLAIEEALIASYRRDFGKSPTANFGRIIPGYRRSSNREGGLIGGILSEGETELNADLGIGPLPWTNPEAVTSDSWMGLDWSEPERLANAYQQIPQAGGVYRLWNEEVVPPLEYIGQSGNLRTRLYRHRRTRDGDLFFSYVPLPEHDAAHKRSEVETELIGAHWLACGMAPRDQF